MEKNLGEQIKNITDMIEDKEFLAKASDEELMGYLFLVEKMKKKLEKLVNLEN